MIMRGATEDVDLDGKAEPEIGVRCTHVRIASACDFVRCKSDHGPLLDGTDRFLPASLEEWRLGLF